MEKVILDMAMSLDGFIAGPNDEYEGFHDWFFSPAGSSREVVNESLKSTGAILMGRRTYDLGDKVDGFTNNPYKVPHFVLTHKAPEKPAKGETAFTFVSGSIENALQQAKAAAGDKYVVVSGGANTAQQFLKAGLLDEIQLHLAPILLGKGIRLFENAGAEKTKLEKTKIIASPDVTHIRFRVLR